MGYPVTLNGRTYTLADFTGQNYVSGFPDALEDFVTDAAAKVAAAELAETNAETAQAAAEAAQTAAEAAQAAAEAAQEAIDGLYLGAQASNPTVDLNGDPLTAGDWYFNTTDNNSRVYDGSSWNIIDPDLSGDASPTLGGDLAGAGYNISGVADLTISGDLTVDTNTLYVDSTNNWVGIGEATPSRKLHVNSGSTQVTSIFESTAVNVFVDFANSATSEGRTRIGCEGADTLTFRTATAERLHIDSSGNVGIGTSSPAGITSGITTLSISDGGAKTTGDKIGALTFITDDASYTNTYSDGVGVELSAVSDSSTGAAYGLSITTGTIGSEGRSERLRIDSKGNVGIGEANPAEKLHISGTGTQRIRVTEEGSSNYAQFVQASSNMAIVAANATGDNEIAFLTTSAGASTEKMRIDSSGNVGIGTASPSSFNQVGADALVVGSGSGEQGITIYSGTANNGVLAFADGTTTTAQYQGYIGYNHSSNFMRFFTSATERMRIDSSGNVGIGTNPSSNLHVYNGANAEEQVIIAEVSGAYSNGAGVSLRRSGTEMGRINADYFDGMTFHATTGSGGAATERMRIDSSGNLLVGGTLNTSAATIYSESSSVAVAAYRKVSTTTLAIATFRSDHNAADTVVARVDVDGDLKNYTGSYGSISDARMKNSITDANSQWDDIKNLRVRKYKMNGLDDVHLGVVAQELMEDGMSGLVKHDPEEDQYSVKYSILYMKAVKALQEAMTRIETLESEVAALKGAN